MARDGSLPIATRHSIIMPLLSILAGPTALRHLQQQGLAPEHLAAIFAASGAAKWLAIYGLDRAIFGQWLPSRQQPLPLFGTSVGAFKLAAACRRDAEASLDTLAKAYQLQTYPDGISAAAIEREFRQLRDGVLGDGGADEILSHPSLRLSCGAVRCHGGLASHNQRRQTLACLHASLRNLSGRSGMQGLVERVVFHDPRTPPPVAALDGYPTETVVLDAGNLEAALTASGSIPVYMYGVEEIAGAGPGVYRDGGLLDYHPVPGNFWRDPGLVLYPHFYPFCKMGWFDKQLPWRKAPSTLLGNTLLLTPSTEFFARTRLGRVPDRADFKRLAGRDSERIDLWQEVMDLSLELGEEFLSLARQGDLASRARPL